MGAAVRFDARMPLIELYRVFHASHALRALAGDADDGFGFGLDAEPSLLVACLAHGVLLTVADVLVLERYVFNADLALRTRIARAADAAPARRAREGLSLECVVSGHVSVVVLIVV